MTDVKDMPEDLKWLAENVTRWPEDIKGFVPETGPIVCYVRERHGKEVVPCMPKSMSGLANTTYTRDQWLSARQQLGLEPASVSDKTDMVNHPPHYQLRQGYEVYDLRQDLAAKAAQANVPHDQYSDWDRMLEYSLRCWQKNGVEDLKKARWYLDKLIEKLEAQK